MPAQGERKGRKDEAGDTPPAPHAAWPGRPSLGRIAAFLLRFSIPELVLITCLFAIAFSEAVASLVSLAMTGEVPPVVMVAAFVTPAIVAPVASLFLATVTAHLRREIAAAGFAEQRLRQAKTNAELANRTKSAFLANMSHELRTPLNAIIGFSEIIQREMLGPVGSPKYCAYAGDIHASAMMLLDLINDILDVSRIEAGKLPLQEAEVDLDAAVAAVVRLMRERAREAGVAIVHEPRPDAPGLIADARRVKQMLLNLLSNAVKFTPAGGRVAIAVETDVQGLVLSVADTGIGIAPEDIPVVLLPFGQADSELNRKYEGAGLGLPLTKGLIELHGGTLAIESAPGKGTRVALRFPPERVLRAPAARRSA